MRLAIVGSRDLPCIEKDNKFKYKLTNPFVLHKILLAIPQILHPSTISMIVSGGARGADTVAEYIAESMHIIPEVYEADWNKYGKSAGPKRNVLIENNSDACFAIVNKPLSQSHGTKHTVSLFRANDKQVFLLEFDEEGKHMIRAGFI